MEMNKTIKNEKQTKTFLFSNGVLYFSRRTERFIFFILTIIMLTLGILVKLGLF